MQELVSSEGLSKVSVATDVLTLTLWPELSCRVCASPDGHWRESTLKMEHA